jgi:tetratricopeptide (TPR) repeat protein
MFRSIYKTNIILSLVCSFLLLSFAQAKDEGIAGTESNFHLGFGARAMGMGRAFTAMADDPTAVFWNPAGLENIFQQSVTFFNTTLYEGATYLFLGYALPTLDLGTFGLGIGRIGVGGIEYRDIDGYNEGYPDFSWDEYQAYLSYAKKLPWNITSGATIRVVRRGFSGVFNEDNLIDYGVGMDLGFLYKPEMFSSPLLTDWSFGLNVHNLFTPQIKEGNVVDELPLSIRLGILRRLYFSGGGNNVNVLLDLDYSEKRGTFVNLGAEYRFKELGMLRTGFDVNGLTFGAGVKYSIFQIDYAFGSGYSSDLPSASVHRVSLSFNFGLNRNEMFEIAEAKRKAEEDRIIANMRESDRQKFVKEHLQKAEDYFNQGEWLEAIVEYQQVITQDPFNNRAQMMLDSADVLLNKQFQSRQDEAIEQALDKERAEINRQFVNERFEKGRLLLDQRQYTEALIEFNRALERAPNDETIKAAIATTRRRLELEISNLLQASRREYQNENYSEALRLLTEARLLGGNNPRILDEIDILTQRYKLTQLMAQGYGLYEIGEYDEATKVFEEALKIDPNYDQAKRAFDRAKIETEGQAEGMPPDVERRYLEGIDLFIKGKYREAIDIWEEIRKEYPYNKQVSKAIEGARERLEKATK